MMRNCASFRSGSAALVLYFPWPWCPSVTLLFYLPRCPSQQLCRNCWTLLVTTGTPARQVFMWNCSTYHRRRINTEEKAKVVASVWGTECIQFLAAPTILHQDELKKRMNCTRLIWRKVWIAPGWFEEKEEFILFFTLVVLVKNS